MMKTLDPIIYIDGELADHMGGLCIGQLAQRAASLAGKPVTVLTHGTSERHSGHRYQAQPLARHASEDKIEEAIRRLQCLATYNKQQRERATQSLIDFLGTDD